MSDKKEASPKRGFFQRLRDSIRVLRDEYVAGRDEGLEPEKPTPKEPRRDIAHKEPESDNDADVTGPGELPPSSGER